MIYPGQGNDGYKDCTETLGMRRECKVDGIRCDSVMCDFLGGKKKVRFKKWASFTKIYTRKLSLID